MFPANSDLQKSYPLQSKVFGHRFREDQTLYEYLLEFLLVVTSRKKVLPSLDEEYKEEYFPEIDEEKVTEIKYQSDNKAGLKRFIFYGSSKQEGRFKLDEIAYKNIKKFLAGEIEMDGDTSIEKEEIIELFQNLLYGFSAVTQNRSWFAQNMLPICPSVISNEIMGRPQNRNKDYIDGDKNYRKNVDNNFEFHRHNFMSRGGEVYYLHVLRSLAHYPQYKNSIEKGINFLINQFPEIEKLCSTIQEIWEFGSSLETENTPIESSLGTIPDGFKWREKSTLQELENLFDSAMHPFEKIDILSYGIIIQIIVMTFDQARYSCNKNKGYILLDVNCYKNESKDEIKKAANKSYLSYSQDITDSLYFNVKGNEKDGKSEQQTIKAALDESIKVYKKIGKKIGFMRPENEKYFRFTINENILKYLVLSLIKPGTKMTLDRFMEKIYEHYRIVIGPKELDRADKKDFIEKDVMYLEENKKDFQSMLKESGFLRELSDSTSIVENPYSGVK